MYVDRRTVCHRQRRFAILFLAIFLFACMSTARGRAEDTPAGKSVDILSLSLEQLGEIEVTTASKEPEAVWKTPAAIYVITQEDIRRAGATSIPEALRLAPGVEVARIDSDHWAIGIRGFGGEFSKSLLVMIDGRSVYSPLFAGVYWQVQDTLIEDIDQIEVIRGPGGTIWGANAVNGIINILTKDASATHGLLSTLGGGNVDQGIGGERFGSSVKNFHYRAYAKGFLRGAQFHPDGKNFDEWRMGQLGFRTDWDATKRDHLTVQGDMYKGRDGERVAVSSYAPAGSVVNDAPHSTSGGNLVASWRRQTGGHSDIELRGYFDRTTRFSPQLDETRNTIDIDLLDHFSLFNGRHDILLGVGARWSPDNITQKSPTLDFLPHQETDSIYSWFAQDQVGILPGKLSLTLGSKFEHNNRSGFEIQPNARILWTPTAHQTLWAAITRAVRTPSRLDQDFQLTDYAGVLLGLPTFIRVTGSKDFRSEHLLGTEIGYRKLVGRSLYVDLSIFRNDYNDLYGYGPGSVALELSPLPAHIILVEPLANALKGHTSGGELTPDWKVSRWFELKGSYSYLHLRVVDKPGFTDAQNTAAANGSSPHHQIAFQALFNLPGRFEIDPAYRYVSSLPAQNVSDYSTVDIRFGWHPTRRLELSVAGQNLLQPHHAEFGSDINTIVGIKRSVFAKITWIR